MTSTEPSKTFGEPGKPSTGNTPASTTPPATPPSADTQKAGVYKLYTCIQSSELLECLSDVLCFRVPIKYIALYRNFSKKEKRIVKQSLVGVIEAVARGAAAQQVQVQGQQTVVLNLNLNVQSQEVHQVHPAGDAIYEERIRQLERKLRHAEQLLRQYRELLRKLKAAASQGDSKTVLATLRNLDLGA